MISGRNVRQTSPAAAAAWAITMDARYPIRSMNPADRQSTMSWIRKFTVISRVMLRMEM